MDEMKQVIAIARAAGEAIMGIYERDFDVQTKGDESPLTEADLAAHQIIVSGLQAMSDLPILSEESADIDWQERKQWQTYWLVDPLDGTKEFIRKNGEFTVNIAKIHQGKPVMGVVYAPALGVTYFGDSESGAFKTEDGNTRAISPSKHQAGETWKVVGSRSHQNPDIDAYLQTLPGDYELVAMGSSLKLCLVAEGAAHLYPRLGPTSEWDTAAAHAVVLAAGGKVVEIDDASNIENASKPLTYNQKESVLNPYFLVNS